MLTYADVCWLLDEEQAHYLAGGTALEWWGKCGEEEDRKLVSQLAEAQHTTGVLREQVCLFILRESRYVSCPHAMREQVCVLMLRESRCVSSCYYTCAHATICVLILLYTCPHTTIRVLMLLFVSSYYCIRVLVL